MTQFEIIKLKNEKGATSIFVIILMVVLFVFGLAALTTALASLKLSEKSSLWNDEYYILEAEAERIISLVDNELIEAEIAARNYITTSEYSDEVDFLTLNSFDSKNIYIEKKMEKIYYNEAINRLNELSKTIDLKVTSEEIDEKLLKNDLVKLWVTYNVKEEKEAFPKNITVVLNILAPHYMVSLEDKQVIREEDRIKRFQVLQWQEWQNEFEYDNAIDFEDPVFENPDFEPEDSLDSEGVEDVIKDEEKSDNEEDEEVFEEID